VSSRGYDIGKLYEGCFLADLIFLFMEGALSYS
jgi:hypothetical protein